MRPAGQGDRRAGHRPRTPLLALLTVVAIAGLLCFSAPGLRGPAAASFPARRPAEIPAGAVAGSVVGAPGLRSGGGAPRAAAPRPAGQTLLGAPAQPPLWVNLTSESRLAWSPLAEAAATWDPEMGRVVVYGGINGSDRIGSTTWGFLGGQWTNLTDQGPPGGLAGASMAYDPAEHSIILFGGLSSSSPEQFTTTTWFFANGSWSAHTLSPSPSPRFGASMAYDPQLGGVVLFGGVNLSSSSGAPLGDLWLLRGDSWSRVASAMEPLARSEASLTYDPTISGLVLFGGLMLGDVPLSDTWIFSEGNWTELPVGAAGTAPPLFGTAGAFDPDLNATVLTGGEMAGAQPSVATFFLNGSEWTPLVTRGGPGAHAEGISVFDPIDNEWVVAGGLGSSSGTDALRAPLSIRSVSSSEPNETGFPIRFTSDIKGANPSTIFHWSWGDGAVSTGNTSNETHTYEAAGNYSVELNATDGTTDSANWSGIVRIAAALGLDVLAASTGADAGVPVTFVASGQAGVPPIDFVWSFPGGAGVDGPRAVLTFPAPGPVTITISATDSVGATATVVRNLTVGAPPTPGSNRSVEADAGVALLLNGTMVGGSAPWIYQWSFPDGSTVGGPVAAYTFPAPGSDLVRLEVRDAGNYSMVQSIAIAVAQTPSVHILGPASVAAGTTYAWSASIQGGSEPFHVEWRLSDGLRAVGPQFTAALPSGTQTLSVTVTDAAGGRAETNLTVHSSNGPVSVVHELMGTAGLLGFAAIAVAAVTGLLLLRRRRRSRTVGPPAGRAAGQPEGREPPEDFGAPPSPRPAAALRGAYPKPGPHEEGGLPMDEEAGR
ncbi:MAG: PKD domain-containing protein [Thermoplasmata archaeon]